MTRRTLGTGAALVGLYLVVAVATLAGSGHRYLPLYEGVGPPPKYLWVNPPPQFASGNTAPGGETTDFPLTGTPAPGFAATPDGQLAINLSAGAIAPHQPDTKVHVVITPVDPTTIGPLPTGVAADGNAYRVELTYTPSGTPVASLTTAGNVVLEAPYSADAIYRAPDGQNWTMLTSQQVSGPSVLGASFAGSGYYLMGTAPHRLATGGSGGSSGGAGTAVVAALAAGVAVIAGAVALVAFRRRGSGR